MGLAGIAPELALVAGLLLLLVLDLAVGRAGGGRRVLLGAALLFLAAAGALIATVPQETSLFDGMLASDGFALFFKAVFLTAAFLAVLFVSFSNEVSPDRFGEYLLLLFSLTLGLCLLVSAQNLLMIYLSIELVSLPSYVLTGFRRGDRRSSEAALKYVIYGAAASGFMLYGFSLLYGMAGTLQLSGVAQAMGSLTAAGGAADRLTVTLALLFSLAGFGYKVAAVPFHMWCPDVYEGAPTPFVAFLSVAPKAAGLAALIRFLLVGIGLPEGAGGFPWPVLLGVGAMATMTLGNLVAIGQQNVKRLLAYSSIAHAGYMLMGVAVGSPQAIQAVMIYAPIYLLMNMGAFFVVMAVRARDGAESMSAYLGLGQRSPVAAIALAIFLFSLTGIPPFAGFIGKFFLFAAVLETRDPFFYAVALVGVVNSVVSLYYYVRIVRAMFLEPSADGAPAVPLAGLPATILTVLAVPTVVLGVWWGPLSGIVARAGQLLR